jgi:hypothetical protein
MSGAAGHLKEIQSPPRSGRKNGSIGQDVPQIFNLQKPKLTDSDAAILDEKWRWTPKGTFL